MAHSYTVTVEIDAEPSTTGIFILDSSALDGPHVLTDAPRWYAVSGDVYAVNIRRGRSDDTREYDAGTCRITLDNRGGRYDPDNVNSVFYVLGEPLLRVGTGVKVTLTPKAGGTAVVVFTGRVAAFDLDHDPVRPTVTLDCEDLIGVLGRTPIPPTGEGSASGDTGAARASWLLDAAGIPSAARDVTAGRQLLGWAGGGTARSSLERIARGEAGRCYVDRSGVLVLSDHAAEYGKTVEAVLSDTGGVPYGALDVRPAAETLVNTATVARDGLDDVRAADAESVARYGHRGTTIDVALASDADCGDLASFHANRRATPTPVVSRVDPVIPRLSAAQLAAVAALDLGSLIEVARNLPGRGGVVFPATVEGIAWDLTPGRQSMSLATAPSDTYGLYGSASWFTLDVSALDGPAVLAPY